MNMDCSVTTVCPRCKGTGLIEGQQGLGWCPKCKGTGIVGTPGCQMSQEALGLKDATPPCMKPKTVSKMLGKLDEIEEKHFGVLPSDSKERKTYPMYEGLLKYFPDALAAVSHLSYVGNEQHNPGQPLHWAKEKSTDHADCIIRHLVDALQAPLMETTEKELTAVAWRALALLQTFYDKRKERK